MAIRVQIPLVVEMDEAQVAAYAKEYGLPHHDGPLRTKDIVDDVQASVLSCVQDSAAFGSAGRGGSRGADVSIKGR